MKALKKLALVSAVSMISAGAFAMEAMDDESMAAATGQDGITILISPGAKTGSQLAGLGVSEATMDMIDNGAGIGTGTRPAGTAATDTTNTAFKGLSIRQVVIHDDDGFGSMGTDATANSGAIMIGSGAATDSTVVFADDATPIRVDIDTVGDHDGGASTTTGGAMLNVKITTPTLAIKQGAVYVANSNAAPIGFDADGATSTAATVDTDGTATSGTAVEIMSGMEIVLGGTTINIQLGNESQLVRAGLTAMISVDATINGGLTINNMKTNDQAGAIKGGSIGASSLVIKDNGGANLTAKVGVNIGDVANSGGSGAAGEGLYVTLAQLGDATNGANITLNDQYLGSNAANDLGDVQLIGLNASGTTLIIRGH